MDVDIDVKKLAQGVAAFLVPCLPYLAKAGEKVGEDAAKAVGSEVWTKAKRIWAMLRLKVEGKPKIQEAIQYVVTDPSDEDAKATLRLELKQLMLEDRALAQEVWELLGRPGPGLNVH